MPDTASDPPIRSIGFLLVPGFALMAYASAVEPLRAANQLSGKTLYRWWNVTPGDVPAVASNGAAVAPDMPLGAEGRDLDLMLVCAGGNPARFRHRAALSWLRRLNRRGVAIGGLSGGPFIIARAGLLDGRRCTVHWDHLPAFREAFPTANVTGSLFELDGNRITCAGGIAGLDMMVALIARDHGHLLAAAVSDWFLHGQMREGMGPQRMDLRVRLGVSDARMLAALQAMESNIEVPLGRAELADIADLSMRQLERAFRRDLGRGVHAHYLRLRLDRARQLLRESTLSVLDVAVATGFGSAAQFSRAFRRVVGFPPREVAKREGLG